jgi:Carboxypeptidase regulatory-like domain
MSQARRFFCHILLFSSFLFALTTQAQDSATGALRGTVSDPSGSRVPQATIVLVNTATGARHSTTSDAEGRFALDLLPPGITPRG